MRLISRNCYRKIAFGFVFVLLSLFVVLLFTQSQALDKSVINSRENNPGTAKSDKTWEWSPEKLNEFMHLLDKHKAPIDNNVIQQLIQPTNATTIIDNKLQFPSLTKYLTYIDDEESALMPSYVLSHRHPSKRASLVFGVPHIRRPKQSYLQLTLYFLIKNLKPEELNDTLIIVFIAETDAQYVTNTTRMIAHHFQDYIASGVLTVISPPKAYYPDFDKQYKKQTLGDPIKRVHWRTKQNLDFAYLMMYAYSRGDYYVQLEDDVISSPDYVFNIKKCITDLKNNNTEWFTIKFCRLGFIGQLLKTQDMPQLITFLLIFHEDQPSDWLLDYLVQVRVCRKDKDAKDCRKRKDSLWRTYPNSQFQHIGYHSSLEGKVQKLKDKFFKVKDFSYFAHKDNPPAEVSASLKPYKDHTIAKAYIGEDYFWSMEPKAGDNITVTFNSAVLLDTISINSGNFEHPDDKIPDYTCVEVMVDESVNDISVTASHTEDGYYIVGQFEDGFIKVENLKSFGLIKKLRIRFTADSKFWLILNEIHIKSL